MRIVRVLTLLLLVLVLSAWQVPEELTTPCAALSWAGTTAGLIIILGVLQAWTVEYIPQWPTIPSKWKRPILFGMAVGASLLVLGGKAVLCGATVDIQLLWEALIAACAVFTVNQNWQGLQLDGSRASREAVANLNRI